MSYYPSTPHPLLQPHSTSVPPLTTCGQLTPRRLPGGQQHGIWINRLPIARRTPGIERQNKKGDLSQEADSNQEGIKGKRRSDLLSDSSWLINSWMICHLFAFCFFVQQVVPPLVNTSPFCIMALLVFPEPCQNMWTVSANLWKQFQNTRGDTEQKTKKHGTSTTPPQTLLLYQTKNTKEWTEASRASIALKRADSNTEFTSRGPRNSLLLPKKYYWFSILKLAIFIA